jgi:hypothetical protein
VHVRVPFSGLPGGRSGSGGVAVAPAVVGGLTGAGAAGSAGLVPVVLAPGAATVDEEAADGPADTEDDDGDDDDDKSRTGARRATCAAATARPAATADHMVVRSHIEKDGRDGCARPRAQALSVGGIRRCRARRAVPRRVPYGGGLGFGWVRRGRTTDSGSGQVVAGQSLCLRHL